MTHALASAPAAVDAKAILVPIMVTYFRACCILGEIFFTLALLLDEFGFTSIEPFSGPDIHSPSGETCARFSKRCLLGMRTLVKRR
eukprot:CAMPEP_0171588138 /NCGR_PEP_ID=MMETSP0961-20121227/13899_1 /TAXON_ID=87120 /ORGANISM="Aurantiochytrium limacinum, Strain ATCCMYA-1381" /LENGTH=85 /DNA_ID=CAMNT_0012146837 /DNA_START=111 /DNA_END=368 /DNA_ORIENTATION=+